jgi:hypothetical protein
VALVTFSLFLMKRMNPLKDQERRGDRELENMFKVMEWERHCRLQRSSNFQIFFFFFFLILRFFQ